MLRTPKISCFSLPPTSKILFQLSMFFIGEASAASEATLSSSPLRFAVYVGIIVRAINP